MPPRRRTAKPKFAPWTEHIRLPSEIAVVTEVLEQGFQLEVIESIKEWNELGSVGTIDWKGGVKWHPTGVRPVRKSGGRVHLLRGLTLIGWTPFGLISHGRVYVWSPRMLAKMQFEYLSLPSWVTWGEIVAHELCHLYWKREYESAGYLAKPDLSSLASRMNLSRAESRLQVALKPKMLEVVRRVAGDEIVDEALAFVQYYPPNQRGEEFLVVVVAAMWAQDAAEWESPEDVRPVRDFFNHLNNALRKAGADI